MELWRFKDLIEAIKRAKETKTYEYVILVDEENLEQRTTGKTFLNDAQVYKIGELIDEKESKGNK